MNKRRVAGLAAVATMAPLGLLLTNPAPAQAGSLCEVGHICGDFYHYSPDNGFDDPIPVTCNLGDPWSNYRMVAEGNHSNCHDSDGFYVGPNRNVSCIMGGEWIKFTSAGWHKFNDSENRKCVHGLDP